MLTQECCHTIRFWQASHVDSQVDIQQLNAYRLIVWSKVNVAIRVQVKAARVGRTVQGDVDCMHADIVFKSHRFWSLRWYNYTTSTPTVLTLRYYQALDDDDSNNVRRLGIPCYHYPDPAIIA